MPHLFLISSLEEGEGYMVPVLLLLLISDFLGVRSAIRRLALKQYYKEKKMSTVMNIQRMLAV